MEDERHFVFECGGYQGIRSRYEDLFEGLPGGRVGSDLQMCVWMNPDADRARWFWQRFARFLRECWAARESLLSDDA